MRIIVLLCAMAWRISNWPDKDVKLTQTVNIGGTRQRSTGLRTKWSAQNPGAQEQNEGATFDNTLPL